MASSDFSIRLIAPGDGPALEVLLKASPVRGEIGFTYDYQADILAVSQALAVDLVGVVAVQDGAVIGMVYGELLPVQWAGGVCQGVYVSNLRVRPDFQRQGLARRLGDWGLAYLTERLGRDVVLYAAIPEGNISLNLAQRHGFISTRQIQGGVIPMRRTPPRLIPGLQIRPASREDLPAFAEGVNEFYREHDLWNPVTPASLEIFLERQVRGIRPNQLYIVTRGGEVVGGLSLSDRTQLVRMRVTGASAFVRLLGDLLGVLPRDGVLRALTVREVWFGDGQLEAGRYLWQQLRYRLRERGDCLGIAYDPHDRLADLFQVPFWLPLVKARYLVRADGSPEGERLIYCIAGA